MQQISRVVEVLIRIGTPDNTLNFFRNDTIIGVVSSPNISANEFDVVPTIKPDLSNSPSVLMSLKNDVVLKDVVRVPYIRNKIFL